jgi:tetratricopeptide (TPR) repeat protein
MSQILQIVVNIFSLIAILGLVIWIFIRALKRSTDPPVLILKWIVTAVALYFQFKVSVPAFRNGGLDAIFGLILTLLFGLVMTIIWRDSFIDIIANGFGSLYDGGSEPPEPKPYYSIALSKRKLYRPLEAVVEIRKQLASFPDDFEGIILLATIQAEDMKDLTGAEMTLNHFCNSPAAPPKQVAAALTHLADWHLKLAQDADSARAALEKIIEKFPGTELALAAAQRIAHLGGAEKILLAAHDRQPMAMPEGVKNIGLRDSLRDLIPAETDPEKLVADYVKHLEQHPLDTEAREKLAIVYAAHYQRLDLATNELAQLINEPNQPPKHVAHWLNLLADLQIRSGADFDTVRPTLEKIIEHFPGMAVAELAQSRLDRLKLEIKGQKETPGMKLGVYEQNIGLKYSSPR